jgi:hypothetical protein
MDLLQVPQEIRVVLDYAQEQQAHSIGFERITQVQARVDAASRRNKGVNYHEAVMESSEAVGAEIAVAQYFGISGFQPTVNTFKNEADIGAKIEVKWTKYLNGHLIVTNNDREHDIAVLVTGRSPVYIIAGWIPITMAKKPRYRNQDGSYWIDRPNLFPIEDLKRSIYGDSSF